LPQPHSRSVGSPFIELQSVDSTNNYALQQIHAGLAHHGTVFFAHEQLQGKGQRGKKWVSEKGTSLMLSAVIEAAPLLLSEQFRLSACVAVSAHELFTKYAVDGTSIKWPNDLYWHDRKAGGILIENIIGGRRAVGTRQSAADSQQSSDWKWAIAGIGININQNRFPEGLTNPVSLKQITGKNHDPVVLAKELCGIFAKNWNDLLTRGFDNIYAYYLAHLYKKNQVVKFKKGSRIFEGTVKTVTPAGLLVVEGVLEEEFTLGEIEWLIPQTSR
jgi:BirA family biotin operon repressor/biotin-[acetyl-CoA-carboxylase] ligase